MPLYSSFAYPIWEADMAKKKKKSKLSNVTWVLGDKPCKTLKMQAGCYTDITKK